MRGNPPNQGLVSAGIGPTTLTHWGGELRRWPHSLPATPGSHWLRWEIGLYGAWLSDGKYGHEGHAESPATVIRAQLDPPCTSVLGLTGGMVSYRSQQHDSLYNWELFFFSIHSVLPTPFI